MNEGEANADPGWLETVEREAGNCYESWGRWPRPTGQRVAVLDRPILPATRRGPLLARGNGRSYGDSCLNDCGLLLDSRRLDHFLGWDEATGHLEVESGAMLAQILDAFAPRGWFLPVVPGTEQITVGGAIANDVHGKNHHRLGSFGDHVERLTLVRSDEGAVAVDRAHRPELFAATVGGLGLTGLIARATLRLRRIPSSWIDVETIPFGTLDEFLDLSAESEVGWEYTVAWGDWRAKPGAPGRGLFLRGNHASAAPPGRPAHPRRAAGVGVPDVVPGGLLNGATIRLFNSWQAHRTGGRVRRECQDYRSFFFPLDGVRGWNRFYGSKGFLQHQCVLPGERPIEALAAIHELVSRSDDGSYLSVLKTFGHARPAGLLSFPRRGVTIALDVPFSDRALALCERLDAVVREAGGAVYAAKDARMSPESFRVFYPQADDLETRADPAFSSSFWRRVRERSPS